MKMINGLFLMFILMERGKDGSDYEGMFDLYVGRTLQKDIINSIPGYHDNKLVQKAISDTEKSLRKDRQKRKNQRSKSLKNYRALLRANCRFDSYREC